MTGFNIDVTKMSGEKEPFSEEKFRESLHRAGVSDHLINLVFVHLKGSLRDGISTKELYEKTFEYLKEVQEDMSVAGRYGLKRALLEIGPSGYPFEKYVGKLFEGKGYAVDIDIMMEGYCVAHEIDVCLHNGNNERTMIECKFHNSQKTRSAVQTSLYMKARFDDVIRYSEKHEKHITCSGCMIVTNTKFTADALAYGECVGIKLMSWGYPKGESLSDLIEETNLHPVTCVTELNKKEKRHLIKQGIITCKDLAQNPKALEALHISGNRAEKIIAEAKGICS